MCVRRRGATHALHILTARHVAICVFKPLWKTKGLRMAHAMLVAVHGGGARVMEETETFLHALGARILARQASSIEALVSHPDGFVVNIFLIYMKEGTEELLAVRRCAGDPTLFALICGMLDFDLGRGTKPSHFHGGQLLPKIARTCYSPPPFDDVDVPFLCLDEAGVKRKLAEL
jgi:hypothetical protein